MPSKRILVVDDEPDIRELVCEILEDEGYAVESAADGEAARIAYQKGPPDLVLLDIWMPDLDGVSLLREWSEAGGPACPVVMISGHGTVETAVEATRLGAYDFVQKPLSLAKLLATVKQALDSGGASPSEERAPAEAAVHEPVGNSAVLQLLRQRGEQAARSDSPLMISGEMGTGRESVARWIHRRSGRAGSFEVLNICAITGDAARGYLFGAAATDRKGLLDMAAEGTLFIPDIQQLPAEALELLDQTLESGQFTPEGSAEPRSVNCRIIAACRPDLETAVRDGKVNEPLYYRLNVLRLDVPPLRNRPEDVPDLARHYADWFPDNDGLPYRSISVAALNRLRNHGWPGNERELRNLVQRLLVMGGEGEISAQEVDHVLSQQPAELETPSGQLKVSFDQPLREAREQFEREYLLYQLERAGGSVGKLSEAVGMERTHLYRKLRALGIDPKSAGTGGGT